MNRRLFLSVFALCILGFGAALKADSPKTETVSFKSGAETATGYLALPGGSGEHPAIIVIHEWWGLNDWIKEQADKFASQGYIALAVDLYRGKSAATPDDAHVLMRGLPDDRGLRDLEAAYAYLASHRMSTPPELALSAGAWAVVGRSSWPWTSRNWPR